jgi:drug/metabolite transporter (DMT)-like permease
VLLLSSASWAAGSLYGRRARGASPVSSTAAQLASGGVALAAVAAIRSEPLGGLWRAAPASLAALAYLIVFGSVVAFTAYVWLLRVASPARVGTYAYVVPAVALVLGGVAGDQRVTLGLVASLAVILAGVALLSGGGGAGPGRPPPPSSGGRPA